MADMAVGTVLVESNDDNSSSTKKINYAPEGQHHAARGLQRPVGGKTLVERRGWGGLRWRWGRVEWQLQLQAPLLVDRSFNKK